MSEESIGGPLPECPTPEPVAEAGGVTLLPCPFCGSTNIDAHGWATLPKYAKTPDERSGPACDDCGASADSINVWNRRTAPATSAPATAVLNPPTTEQEKYLRKIEQSNNYDRNAVIGGPAPAGDGEAERNEYIGMDGKPFVPADGEGRRIYSEMVNRQAARAQPPQPTGEQISPEYKRACEDICKVLDGYPQERHSYNIIKTVENLLADYRASQPTGDVGELVERLREQSVNYNDGHGPLHKETAEALSLLADPNAVHLNMLRGNIAKPSFEQIKHIYKAEFDAADSRLTMADGVAALGGIGINAHAAAIDAGKRMAGQIVKAEARVAELVEKAVEAVECVDWILPLQGNKKVDEFAAAAAKIVIGQCARAVRAALSPTEPAGRGG